MADATAEMTVRLKDGRTIVLPIERRDVESVQYETGGSTPAARAAAQAQARQEAIRGATEAATRAARAAEAAETAAREATRAAETARKALDDANKAAKDAVTAGGGAN